LEATVVEVHAHKGIPVVLALLLLHIGQLSRARADSLAEEVAKKNRAAVESIHTFSCRYAKARHNRDGKLIEQFPEVEYWRSGMSFRSRWQRGEQWCDTVVNGLQMQSTSNHVKTGAVVSSRCAYDGFPSPEGDPWLDTLVMFIGDVKKNPSPIHFADVLSVPEVNKVAARRTNEHGRPYVVVDLRWSDGTSQAEYWFDPAANYLISRRTTTVKDKGQELGVKIEVERFTEAVPGIYFPEKIKRTNMKAGQVTHLLVSQVKDVRVNERLPEAVFQPGLKPGTRVLDDFEGIRYVIGPDGKSQTKIKNLGIPGPPIEGKQWTETTSEPQPIWRWLFLVSVLVLAACGGLWLGRRWRLRSR
jgi:hypothetical protein